MQNKLIDFLFLFTFLIQHKIQYLRGGFVRGSDLMRVNDSRCLNVGMPEAFGDCLYIHAVRDHQGGVRIAQGVNMDRRQIVFFYESAEP